MNVADDVQPQVAITSEELSLETEVEKVQSLETEPEQVENWERKDRRKVIRKLLLRFAETQFSKELIQEIIQRLKKPWFIVFFAQFLFFNIC